MGFRDLGFCSVNVVFLSLKASDAKIQSDECWAKKLSSRCGFRDWAHWPSSPPTWCSHGCSTQVVDGISRTLSAMHPWGCPMADKEHDMSSPNTNLTLEQHVLGISGKPLQRNAFFHNRSEHMESGRPLNKQRRTYDSGKPLQPDTHHFYEL